MQSVDGLHGLVWRTVPVPLAVVYRHRHPRDRRILEIDVGFTAMAIPSIFWGIGEAVRLSPSQCQYGWTQGPARSNPDDPENLAEQDTEGSDGRIGGASPV